MQIVHSRHHRSRSIEHIGSAHTDADWELLVAAARQKRSRDHDFRSHCSPSRAPAKAFARLSTSSHSLYVEFAARMRVNQGSSGHP